MKGIETTMPVRVRLAALATLITATMGCGLGTAGIAAGANGGGGGSVDPTLTSFEVLDSKLSPATLRLEATRPFSAELFYALPGEAAKPMSTLAGPGVVGSRVDLTRGPIELAWDFSADIGSSKFRQGVGLSVRNLGGLPIDGGVLTVGIGNDAPVVESVDPLPTDPAEPEESAGIVEVQVAVSDTSGDVVSLVVEWKPVGASSWLPATEAGQLPQGIQTPANGMAEVVSFFWNTAIDIADAEAVVSLRAIASDSVVSGVPALSSRDIRIDNNEEPIAVLSEGAFLAGRKERGNIPVPFQVFDQDSDEVDVLIQWRAFGQPFPLLPSDPSELRSLLRSPARAAERARLQVADEAPPVFSGYVGAYAESLPSDQIPLPDLLAEAAGLLAQRNGIEGRVLEILRPHTTPERLAWDAGAVDGPVAASVTVDGLSLLVLDRGTDGWRLRELDLETGAVIRDLGAGAGQPKGLGIDPAGIFVFVASTTALFRIDAETGGSRGTLLHSFVDGPRDVAALGSAVALATGDDRIVRFDFEFETTSVVLDGLVEPWGIAADPLAEGQVIVAERGADRVASFDLDQGVLKEVPALVAPEDVDELGLEPLPAPLAISLEGRGERLLVVCDEGAALRSLDRGSPHDLDGAVGGAADAFVRSVPVAAAQSIEGVATHPAPMRVLCVPDANEIWVGGGVSQRRRILSPSSESDLRAFDPRTAIVQVEEPFDPVPPAGAPWRIQAPVRPRGTPEGRSFTFIWDSADVPDVSRVQLRMLPLDGELGTSADVSGYRSFKSRFAEGAQIGLGSIQNPVSAASGDLDGDGDHDVVAVGSDGVVVFFFQDRARSFVVGPTFPLGNELRDVALGDLDGDGDTDVVAAGLDVTFFFQVAPGVFQQGTTQIESVAAESVAVSDLNGDGESDLAIVSGFTFATELTVYFQTAPGEFANERNLQAHPHARWLRSVQSTDLDGDGDNDLVSADWWGESLAVFLQVEPGIFEVQAAPPQTSPAPIAVCAADLDGDGDTDLVSANSVSGSLSLIFQEAPGVFATSETSLQVNGEPRGVTCVDVDGDRDIDVAVSVETAGEVVVFFQSSPGVFKESVPLRVGGAPLSVAASDLDGDGYSDLMVATGTAGDVIVRFQQAIGEFDADGQVLVAGGSPYALAAGDLDQDGDQDLVVTKEDGDELEIFMQTVPGVFAPHPDRLSTGREPVAVAIADLDGDSDLDLVTANAADRTLTLFFQGDSGEFVETTTINVGVVFSLSCLAAADLDGDGDVDLTANGPPLSFLGAPVFFQTSPGVFEGSGFLPEGARSLVAADLDGDGDNDLAHTSPFGPGSVYILLQHEPGQFGSDLVEDSDGAEWVAAGDLDGDGDNDLVTVDPMEQVVDLFIQGEPGSFTLHGSLPVGQDPVSAVVEDFNGDGACDILVANAGSNDLTCYLQHAPGVFVLAEGRTTGRGPQGLIVADLDGDGDPDVATANKPVNQVVIRFNGD